MTAEQFCDLLILELRERPDLWGYYKILTDPRAFDFRRSYYERRLEFIGRRAAEQNPAAIFDCGCGYGTSALFLALNGFRVHGTTLEHYASGLEARRRFWSAHGNVDSFTCSHENLFDRSPAATSYDMILVQDTLHHLEPLSEALGILRRALTPHGRLVAVEENGGHLVQRLRLYLRRGSKRVTEIYDEASGRNVLMGNENIRSEAGWSREFRAAGFDITEVEYIRLLPAPAFVVAGRRFVERLESSLSRSNSHLRRSSFFGLNFVAIPATSAAGQPVLNSRPA